MIQPVITELLGRATSQKRTAWVERRDSEWHSMWANASIDWEYMGSSFEDSYDVNAGWFHWFRERLADGSRKTYKFRASGDFQLAMESEVSA